MIKKGTIIMIFCIVFALQPSAAQQPVWSVQSFEYIKDSDTKHWLNTPEAGWVKDSIRKSFANAIQRRWDIALPEISLSIKALGVFSLEPRFNTKLKNKQPDTWYIFFQVFDMNKATASFHDNSENLSVVLRLKCRIINGSSDSLILDRELTVKLYTEPVPPGQVALTKLPAYPAYFAEAFDSIATWLFAPETESQKSITLKPACVFTEPGYNNQPLSQLGFASDDTGIHLLTQPSFSFKTSAPSYRKTEMRRNIGGNTATGALSLLTGADLGKGRTKKYSANFPFETGADTFHCIVNYEEWETAERKRVKDKDGYSLESGEYSVAQRSTDSGFINVITMGADTIASFSITYVASNERAGYTRLWDGTESSTIIPLPKEWNNAWSTPNVFIKGTTEGNTFIMQSSRERAIKDFFVNGQFALSIYGKKLPSKALLFQKLSPMQMKVFTILSSLPYSYFNYAAY